MSSSTDVPGVYVLSHLDSCSSSGSLVHNTIKASPSAQEALPDLASRSNSSVTFSIWSGVDHCTTPRLQTVLEQTSRASMVDADVADHLSKDQTSVQIRDFPTGQKFTSYSGQWSHCPARQLQCKSRSDMSSCTVIPEMTDADEALPDTLQRSGVKAHEQAAGFHPLYSQHAPETVASKQRRYSCSAASASFYQQQTQSLVAGSVASKPSLPAECASRANHSCPVSSHPESFERQLAQFNLFLQQQAQQQIRSPQPRRMRPRRASYSVAEPSYLPSCYQPHVFDSCRTTFVGLQDSCTQEPPPQQHLQESPQHLLELPHMSDEDLMLLAEMQNVLNAAASAAAAARDASMRRRSYCCTAAASTQHAVNPASCWQQGMQQLSVTRKARRASYCVPEAYKPPPAHMFDLQSQQMLLQQQMVHQQASLSGSSNNCTAHSRSSRRRSCVFMSELEHQQQLQYLQQNLAYGDPAVQSETVKARIACDHFTAPAACYPQQQRRHELFPDATAKRPRRASFSAYHPSSNSSTQMLSRDELLMQSPCAYSRAVGSLEMPRLPLLPHSGARSLPGNSTTHAARSMQPHHQQFNQHQEQQCLYGAGFSAGVSAGLQALSAAPGMCMQPGLTVHNAAAAAAAAVTLPATTATAAAWDAVDRSQGVTAPATPLPAATTAALAAVQLDNDCTSQDSTSETEIEHHDLSRMSTADSSYVGEPKEQKLLYLQQHQQGLDGSASAVMGELQPARTSSASSNSSSLRSTTDCCKMQVCLSVLCDGQQQQQPAVADRRASFEPFAEGPTAWNTVGVVDMGAQAAPVCSDQQQQTLLDSMHMIDYELLQLEHLQQQFAAAAASAAEGTPAAAACAAAVARNEETLRQALAAKAALEAESAASAALDSTTECI